MSDDKKYNGWNTYETWLVNLWIDGNEYINEMAQESYNDAVSSQYFTKEEQARLDLADRLKDYVEELQEMEVSQPSGLFADLLNSAMREIDWYDLAESYLSEVDKEDEVTEEETE